MSVNNENNWSALYKKKNNEEGFGETKDIPEKQEMD